MSTLQAVIEKQERRSGRSAHQVCNLGHRSGVCGLQQRRSDWLMRISDLLGELELAMSQVDTLNQEIEEQDLKAKTPGARWPGALATTGQAAGSD